MKYHTSTSQNTQTPNRNGRFHRILRTFALLCIGALAMAACGSDGDPVSAGSDDGTPTDNGITDPANAGDNTGDNTAGDTEDITDKEYANDYDEAIAEGADDPTTDYVQPIDVPLDEETAELWARLIKSDVVDPADIVDPQPWVIDQALAQSADATELILRYTAGNAPCTQPRVTVVETGDTIEVSLDVGLHPDVAAMSCLAGTSGSEIVVPLESPAGDREVIAIQP